MSCVYGKIVKDIYVLKTFQSVISAFVLFHIQSEFLYGLFLLGVELNDILLLQIKAIRCITSIYYIYILLIYGTSVQEAPDLKYERFLYNLRVLKFLFKLYNLESSVFFLNYLDNINEKYQFYNLRNNHIRVLFTFIISLNTNCNVTNC